MAVIVQCELNDPHVGLYRPHDPAGLWIVQVQESATDDTGWYNGPDIGNVSMREPAIRALRDALNRELADVIRSAR